MKVAVYGLGAIGSNLILQLMKQYPDFEYTGIDFDRIEERNIRTQAYFREHVGMSKVNAISILAARYLKQVKYQPLNIKVAKEIFDNPDALGLDCFDNSKSRKLLCNKNFKNVLHIGFSAQYSAEIIWQDKYDAPGDVDPQGGDICSMTEAVPFIHFVVNFAGLVISDFINKNEKNSYIITNKFNIRKI